MTSSYDLNADLERYDVACDIHETLTPPSTWYSQPEFLAAEKSRVFSKRWVYAAPSEKVRAAGEWVTGELLGEPWILIRDESGTLRAFANTCRHHASRLADGEGCSTELVCPYHGWVYGLDGRLTSAPGLGKTAAFDPANCKLHRYNVHEAGPFVFLCLDANPPAFEATLQPLLETIDASGLVWFARREYELECNWKVFADNYLDGGYHISHLHKGLDAQLDMRSYATELFDLWSLQTAGAAAGAAKLASEVDPRDRISGGARYAYLYPNFAINRYGPVLDTNWILPLSVDRTQVVFDFWISRDRLNDEAFIESSLRASESTQLEDIAICKEVQLGLLSKHFDRGPYAGIETGMRHFHQLLSADLRRHADD